MKLIKWANKLFKVGYWYRCTFVYLSVNGRQIFKFHANVCLTTKKLILNHREIKRYFHNHVKNSRGLCNGNLVIEEINYLGYFKRK